MKTVDGVDEGSSSHIQVSFHSSFDDFFSSVRHDFLQTSINNINLSGSFQEFLPVELFRWQPSGLLNNVKKVLFGFFLPFSVHSAWSHVFQVFQPFEITDGNTSCVTKNVGKELDAFLFEDCLALHGGWTVGGLDD